MKQDPQFPLAAYNAEQVGHAKEIFDVLKERARQDAKFGPQDRPPFEWFLILSEEVGEVAKECVEMQFNDASHPNSNPEAYYKELTETVAVGLAAMRNFNARKGRAAVLAALPNSISFKGCSACGGEHSGLEVFARETDPYVICPTLNRQVFVSVTPAPEPAPAMAPNGNVIRAYPGPCVGGDCPLSECHGGKCLRRGGKSDRLNNGHKQQPE